MTAVRRLPAPSSHPEEVAIAARLGRAHWHCPICGQPCRCDGPARLLPHTPCGLAAERS